jgi:hypothetical protein
MPEPVEEDGDEVLPEVLPRPAEVALPPIPEVLDEDGLDPLLIDPLPRLPDPLAEPLPLADPLADMPEVEDGLAPALDEVEDGLDPLMPDEDEDEGALEVPAAPDVPDVLPLLDPLEAAGAEVVELVVRSLLHAETASRALPARRIAVRLDFLIKLFLHAGWRRRSG